MEYPAPTPYTPTPLKPNSNCFLDPKTTSLTLALASKYFFLKTGDYASFVNSSLFQLDGTVIQTQYLTGITIGTSAASKCLVMDSNNKITINDITTPTLTITGNNTLSGTTSVLSLSGTSSILTLSNTQASTNGSTGAIRCSGGVYFGNDCVFATQASFGTSVINQTNAGYLVSISPGTASASKCVVVDVNKDISSFRNLTATNLIGSTTIT